MEKMNDSLDETSVAKAEGDYIAIIARWAAPRQCKKNCFFLLLRSTCTTFAVKEAINPAHRPSAAP